MLESKHFESDERCVGLSRITNFGDRVEHEGIPKSSPRVVVLQSRRRKSLQQKVTRSLKSTEFTGLVMRCEREDDGREL